MRLSSAALARSSAQRPWVVVGIWLVALVVTFAIAATSIGSALTTDFSFTDEPESEQAAALIEELRGESTIPELVIVASETGTVQDPAFAGYVGRLQEALSALIGETEVVFVGSYLTESGPVSEDGTTALLPVVVQTQSFGVLQEIAGEMNAIIDEVDNILIDEARTPLIISREADNQGEGVFLEQAMAMALAASCSPLVMANATATAKRPRGAAARGCPTADGRGMLLHQGVRSFELWTGRQVPGEAMRAGLARALAARSAGSD